MNNRVKAAKLLRIARELLAEDFEEDSGKLTRKTFDKVVDNAENKTEEGFETLEDVIRDALKLEKFLKALTEKITSAKGVKSKQQARTVLKALQYILKQSKEVVDTNHAVSNFMTKIVNDLRGEMKLLDKATKSTSGKSPSGGSGSSGQKTQVMKNSPAVFDQTQVMN